MEEDIPVIHKFLYDLAVYQGLEKNFTITESTLSEIIFGKKNVSSLVMRNDDEVYAIAMYYYKTSTFSGKDILFIEDIIIAEDKRNDGYGKIMFEFLENIAKSNGCACMEWNCLSHNKIAQKAYNSYGGMVNKNMLVYEKKV